MKSPTEVPDHTRLADVFDRPGLFSVPLGRQGVTAAAAKTLEPPTRPSGHGRVARTSRGNGRRVVERSRPSVAEREERRAWIEESERWLRGRGHRPDPTRVTWLGEFYDEQSEEWRQNERNERDTDALLRRLRTRSASG